METTRFSLLARVRDPDNSRAWSEFDRIYRPILFRFVLARGVRPGDAEDIVQRCMLTVAQRIGRFAYDPRRGRFRSWLAKLAESRVRDFLRSARHVPAVGEQLDRLPAPDPSPETTFERIWEEEHLRYCLEELRSELDATSYEAFRDYALLERPAAEVCRDFGLQPAQLYKLKWRVTRAIAEKMKDLGC